MANPIISFKDVTKIYPNGFKALNNVNLEINEGEFVAIIGLSGAGKSTLLRTINKMHTITSGELIVNDCDVSLAKGLKLRLLRRNIGMVFQSFNLVKRSSVLNNVLIGRVAYHSTFSMLLGLYTKEDKLRSLEALDKLNIAEKAFQRADTLSGGEQQRVALARVLTQESKIILADEPVASLDPKTTIDVMEDFARINKDYNLTIIANMHHVDLALKYASRIIGINKGEIVYDGSSNSVTDAIITQIYGRSLTSKEKLGSVLEDEI
ncbi:MAG: phosphonate ABC transporter ATP-binding protein [Acholeplasmatales bacterium]|jgi:phosphonate transport system ATP-binding protein|nr:phosphonate ABC transporter ATP-binding protein [Acholeplasmatales bacterium]